MMTASKPKSTQPAGHGANPSAKTAAPRRIAIIDDDESVQDFLGTVLKLHGYEVNAYASVGKFLDGVVNKRPDILVLDIELPGIGGLEFLETLKGHAILRSIPVILVTGKYRTTKDVVRGLQNGADEYLTHPIQQDYLIARIEALLRRAAWREGGMDRAPSIRMGPLSVDPDSRIVRIDEQEVSLTPLEFDLLVYMLKNRNRVLTRGLILEKVWKGESSMTTRTVDKHVEALRKKLDALGKKIDTVVGVGYVLRD